MREYFSLYAEQAVIGSILLDNEITETLVSICQPADFYDQDAKAVFNQCLILRGNSLPIDVISLSDAMPMLPSGNVTIAYAAEIHSQTASTKAAEAYAKAIKEKAQQRAYRAMIASLARDADMSEGSFGDMLASAQNAIQAVSQQSAGVSVGRIGDLSKTLVDDIVERMETGGKAKGLMTGLKEVDGLIRGARGSQVIVLAARPGVGKTSLAINIAEHNALQGIPSLIFSLEMSGFELSRRVMASVGRIPLSAIDDAALNDYGAHITKWKQLTDTMPMHICDKGGLTIAEIRSIARFQHKMNGIKMVVIDYIGLIRTTTGRNSTRSQELGEVSRQVKEMAKELDIPVILLAQLNRDIEKGGERDPRLSDLRDSGEIEQDADIVAFLSRTQDDGVIKFTVAKHRHSKTGDCVLVHRGDFSRFENLNRENYTPPPPKKSISDF